ncbi:MAG: hypothetical protein GXO64_01790 [Candidatus Micrarchaeota archaeon]|nr:hypothetical protein [Candidatus Micrarchaeota archaeon]
MEKAVKGVIETLKNFREVTGIAFGGSYARNLQDRYSDVDIYVFYKNKITDEKIRRESFSSLAYFEKMFVVSSIDFFFSKGKIIHTWWVDIRKLKADIENGDFRGRALIADSKPVWDRNGKIRELKKAARFPKSLVRRVCIEDGTLNGIPIIFRELVIKSLYRNRIYFAEFYIQQQTDKIIKVIYALNRKYYYSYPQYLASDFRKFKHVPKSAYAKINKIGRFSLIENPKEKLTALYKLYWGVIEQIERHWKFPRAEFFPEYGDRKWYERKVREISEHIKKQKHKKRI